MLGLWPNLDGLPSYVTHHLEQRPHVVVRGAAAGQDDSGFQWNRMLIHLPRLFARLLVVVHIGLVAWALVGVIELVSSTVPWPRVSNPSLSPKMLLLQWLLVLTAAGLFIGGYVSRWKHTRGAMAVVYTSMAIVCAYQTFFILEHPGRFIAMAIEYVEYGVILTFLFCSKTMQAHFAGGPMRVSLRERL